ncbi:aspartyl-phosphate phosphatase Spo0E family protein [Tepidibacter hydrothermalis]|uniref:Aspartyl-phosphate phosphatase Spo0E family protein n=1 Tax=Tepidibacter hydrothermalis TaxID=3036126 RepID=A0ABY8EFX9_9FIRM|nr:aspartyl-phosphate phosphatase Spo0E family protein [Tepidibacter hydrothermalis]WFD11858.1 aspartyl-phosphate phosphatase Spo0E family protein [Tepidibacter hydrothermalis]
MILWGFKDRESRESYYENFYREVEETREELNNLITEKNENLSNEEVIKLSQYLDGLILKYQRIIKKFSF